VIEREREKGARGERREERGVRGREGEREREITYRARSTSSMLEEE
jgi:hypothetical protein